jgi:hypothetical protein
MNRLRFTVQLRRACPAIAVCLSLAWPAASGADDGRMLVDMPPAAIDVMRAGMRDHLTGLQLVLAALADDRLEDAAEAAASRIGSGSMGHGGDVRPGRHMPAAMRALGMQMHAAGDAVAAAARRGDREGAWRATAELTAACQACHASYRVR